MSGRILIPVLLALIPPVIAAPLERDLGQGLRLFRLHELPGDLPTASAADAKGPPCVVDVRYAKADDDAAKAFFAWLKFRAKPRAPVFVLVNGDTAGAVLETLTAREKGGGIVVIGAPSRKLEPDIPTRMTGEDERRAYDALEKGTAVGVLLTDNPDKVRNDEASLSRDRLADASADTAADALAPKRVVPPIDTALQRAVHLHRTLLALRKL
jgi:hypothetical protein